MDRRPLLHNLLKALFDTTPNVYFQPPSGTMLKYPCIVYKLQDITDRRADNLRYIEHRSYEVTVIDRDPNSELRERVLKLIGGVSDIKWDEFNLETDADYHALVERALSKGLKLFIGGFNRPFISDNLNHYVFTIYY